jgi:polyisoprenoid-binding protein YceI
MKRRLLLALVVAATLSSASAYAQTSKWSIDPAHSSVNFEILHMGVSHVRGAFSSVKGIVTLDDKDITKSSVDATIDTTTVSTGVEMRDKDLKSSNFFDVEKYPSMTFKSTSVTKAAGKLQLIGDLTLNGVTKSVTLDFDGPASPRTIQGKTISGVSASGTIKRSDFNFGAPKFNAMLGNEVKFTIDVEIDKQ